jgi:hypothetical protein
MGFQRSHMRRYRGIMGRGMPRTICWTKGIRDLIALMSNCGLISIMGFGFKDFLGHLAYVVIVRLSVISWHSPA